MKWKRTFRSDPDYEEVMKKRGGWVDKTVIAILVLVLFGTLALIAITFLAPGKLGAP